MASINFNPFNGNNWFNRPQNPIQPINLIQLLNSHLFKPQHKSLNFASISSNPPKPVESTEPAEERPGKWEQMGHQFFWECENIPDYRHTPEVDKIMNEDPLLEPNPTEEQIKESDKWWEEFRSNPLAQFLARCEEIEDEINEMELEENADPYRSEDSKLWKNLPHVTGLDGRPMPRKAITTKEESDDKFWDFMKQFQFGLWGFKQRPYPPGRPIDVAQAIGYKRLEKRYYDFIMRSGGWYYKDRLGRTRGPCELITLKTAWGGGIIDRDTFIWGEDLDEWAPIHMIYGMERAIATWEVRLGAAATACLHKLQKGIPPWVPLKGFEKKTYKQLQDEAVESKQRDLAVMRANGGVWPGVRTPSYALFLWASGSELTTMLEEDHMPNKFIPKDLRIQLAKIIPGLRPWEVLSIEQAMDKITFNGEWYREPLGSYTTGPPYIRNWNRDITKLFRDFLNLNNKVLRKLSDTIPGFDKVAERVMAEERAKEAKRAAKQAAKKRAEEEAVIKTIWELKNLRSQLPPP